METHLSNSKLTHSCHYRIRIAWEYVEFLCDFNQKHGQHHYMWSSIIIVHIYLLFFRLVRVFLADDRETIASRAINLCISCIFLTYCLLYKNIGMYCLFIILLGWFFFNGVEENDFQELSSRFVKTKSTQYKCRIIAWRMMNIR